MIHPTRRSLKRYVAGVVPERRGRRLRRHLERCSRCRADVDRLFGRPESLRERMERPRLADVWDRIAERVESGDRLILPVPEGAASPVGPARMWQGRWRTVAVAAAAIVVLGSALLFLRTPEASAAKSDLQFVPAKPTDGGRVTVLYRPGALLAGEETLRLRARFRAPGTEAYYSSTKHVVAGLLTRGQNGSFEGSFTLPDSTVYAAFAVEDLTGERVDTNDRRLWELMVHGPDGRPLRRALVQRVNDLMGWNWELAYKTSRMLVDLYPEHVQSWNLLRFFQSHVLFGEARDSSLAVHRRKLVTFDETYGRRNDLSGDELGWMMWYALSLKDSVLAKKWKKRFLAEAPLHDLALQERVVMDVPLELRQDPARHLQVLEGIWDEVGSAPNRRGPGYSHLVRSGFEVAVEAGDDPYIVKWSQRYLEAEPRRWFDVDTRLAERPELRPVAKANLWAELHRLEAGPDEDRPLRWSVSEHRRRLHEPIQRVLVSLGRTLLADGDSIEAARVLDRAVATFWSPTAYREIAELKLAMGDTLGSARLSARLAVDATTDPSRPDSVAAELRGATTAATWERWKREARVAMSRLILADQSTKAIPHPIHLKDSQGRVHTLEDLAAGKPSVVVFWSHRCGPAIRALPQIERVARWAASRGAELILVTYEEPSASLDRFLGKHRVSVPLYFDYRSEALVALENFGTPVYYVLDASGQLAFDEQESLEAIPRQLAALLEPNRVAVGE